MSTVRMVGFFRELPYGDVHGASLKAAAGHLREVDLDRIVSYLKNGAVLAVSPGITRDILSKDKSIIGGGAILTDGKWAWHADLSYYVGTYRVSLPEEFLRHMEDSRWEVGPVNVEKIQLSDS